MENTTVQISDLQQPGFTPAAPIESVVLPLSRSSSTLCIFSMWESRSVAYKPPEHHFLRLGPYHAEETNPLQQTVLNKVLSQRGAGALRAVHESQFQTARQAVEESVPAINAKGCYEKRREQQNFRFPDDTRFREIMARDGCFVLEFMHIMTTDADPVHTISQKFAGETWRINGTLLRQVSPLVISFFMKREGSLKITHTFKILLDMLALRNQIPMSVLRNLHELLRYETPVSVMLNSFLRNFFMGVDPSKHTDSHNNLAEACHLLDAARMAMLPGYSMAGHLPEQIPGTGKNRSSSYGGMSLWYSAMDLRDAGFKILRGDGGKVEWIDATRVLRLPPILINKDSGFIFSNMVAFEQRLLDNSHPAQPVSSYLRLLNDLLRKPADVRELSCRGVIVNHLSADDDVVGFFKKLKLLDTYGMDVLADTRRSINQRCKSKMAALKADLSRNYCRSNWAFCSILAAIVLLILTFLQVIYAMVSYHRPPT